MSMAQSLLPEFGHEFATLRQTLERVPKGKGDFAPHPKSMPMGRLAGLRLNDVPVPITYGRSADEGAM